MTKKAGAEIMTEHEENQSPLKTDQFTTPLLTPVVSTKQEPSVQFIPKLLYKYYTYIALSQSMPIFNIFTIGHLRSMVTGQLGTLLKSNK